jgi:tetratricopeptide (TPR) repeat protein
MKWFTNAFGKSRTDWAEEHEEESDEVQTLSADLPVLVQDAIDAASARGDEFAAGGAYAAAVQEYGKAWALVPDPKTRWPAATAILAAIADAYFLEGSKGAARAVLQDAMNYPGAVGNPFLHLRLGEVLLDAGEVDLAAAQLKLAHAGAGEDIFAAEDSRYLMFLKARA